MKKLLLIILLSGCSYGSGVQVKEASECTQYQFKESSDRNRCISEKPVFKCTEATAWWLPDKIFAICETKQECNEICKEKHK